ncbi:hypothetical protein NPIL_411741 [Nephila pilipes]|uniref:Uncharacterized protein n=1 Tax=Nephila pilipes TaxID=299642 RepID=A0A8X6IMN2_NEPPI|nr:hypothetical protein NPIL_411741 [Nephila pilipes]
MAGIHFCRMSPKQTKLFSQSRNSSVVEATGLDRNCILERKKHSIAGDTRAETLRTYIPLRIYLTSSLRSNLKPTGLPPSSRRKAISQIRSLELQLPENLNYTLEFT